MTGYRKSAVGISLFAVVALLLTLMVYVTLQRSVSGDTNSYTAEFTDVSGLKVGDDVRMAGVRIGRVDTVELVGTTARVGFEVPADQLIFGNTTVSVTYQNIIGQRYLGLSMGDYDDPRPLVDGDVIPVSHTEPSFDISALLNGFEPLFTLLDPVQVDNITSSLITALQGDAGALTTLISETSALAQQFAGPDDVLGQVIENLSAVVDTLAGQTDDITAVVRQTRVIFDGLAQNKNELFQQVDTISSVASRAATVVDGAQPSLEQFVGREPGFAHHWMTNKDAFADFGWNLPMLLKGLGRISQTGYIGAMACDVTISAIPGLEPLIPTIVDQATPGGRAQHSQKCR